MKAQAYECDGPSCTELAPRAPRAKGPNGWTRITIARDGDANRAASFHTTECAHEWLDQQLGDPEPRHSTMVGEVGEPYADDSSNEQSAEATF